MSAFQVEGDGVTPVHPHQFFLKEITTPDNRELSKTIISEYHSYKKKTRTVGRQINWLIEEDSKPVGTIGISSCGIFLPQCIYKYIGVTAVGGHALRTLHLQRMATNWRFTLTPEASKNTGSKSLALMSKICRKRWLEKYHEDLVLLISWIELPRKGTVYTAAGWDKIGLVKNVVNEEGTGVIGFTGKVTSATDEGLVLSRMPFGTKKFDVVQNTSKISKWYADKPNKISKGTLKYRWIFAKPLTSDWKKKLVLEPKPLSPTL